MTPDDIFAAHMWPWPDPLIKRDPAGRVLFVNAAFLQLYGGRVEDWRGNVVTGWPEPNVQAGPHRFETRIGEAHAPTVFDWLETPMADGSALAIARNVSLYAVPPAPTGGQPLPDMPAQSEPVMEQTPPEQAPAEQAAPPVQAPEVQPAMTVEAEPQMQAHVEPQAEPQPDYLDVPELTVPDITAPELEATEADAVAPEPDAPPQPALAETTEAVTEVAPTEAAEVTQASAPEAAPAASDVLLNRDDRPADVPAKRALPLESDSAVLGANWRDAVIAKAVGAKAPEAEKPADTTSLDAQAASDGPSKEIRILLAEDNAINALLTHTLLEAEGCIVDTVEDGALALAAVQKAHYDLIFMDMRMPNMDGLESTRKIRALGGKYASLPIVALTANAFDDDRNACFDSGMNDFMTKPVSAEELSEMVRTWTKNREQRMAS